MSTWTHTKTEVIETEVTQIGLNFHEYNAKFREIRNRINSEIDNCGLCEAKFTDGQMMNIAFTSRGNKLICQGCVDVALVNGVPANEPKIKEG